MELVAAAVDVCVLRSIIEGLSLGVPTVHLAPLASAAQGPAQHQQLGAAAQAKNNEGGTNGETEKGKKTGGGGGVSAATAARALALAAELGALGFTCVAVAFYYCSFVLVKQVQRLHRALSLAAELAASLAQLECPLYLLYGYKAHMHARACLHLRRS